MAVVARQRVCEECGNFTFTEATGLYNYNDNAGGYGAPNDDFGETEPYTAAFIPPGETAAVYTIDLLDDTPDPDTTTGYYEWEVTPADLGLTVITSGIWTVRITLGTNVTDIKVLARSDLRRKIQDCACGSSCEAKTAKKLLIDLEAAAVLGSQYQFAKAQKMIDELYEDVKNCACSGGGCGC